jgi:hypothetical protein
MRLRGRKKQRQMDMQQRTKRTGGCADKVSSEQGKTSATSGNGRGSVTHAGPRHRSPLENSPRSSAQLCAPPRGRSSEASRRQHRGRASRCGAPPAGPRTRTLRTRTPACSASGLRHVARAGKNMHRDIRTKSVSLARARAVARPRTPRGRQPPRSRARGRTGSGRGRAWRGRAGP